MDEMDRFALEMIMGALTQAMEASDEEVENVMADLQEATRTGARWFEEAEAGDNQHKEITFPLYVLGSRVAMNHGVTPVSKDGVVLLSTLAILLQIATQKAYEKGKREALASLILEGKEV